MDRKGILIIILTLGVLFGYNIYVKGPRDRENQKIVAAQQEQKKKEDEIKAKADAEALAQAQARAAATAQIRLTARLQLPGGSVQDVKDKVVVPITKELAAVENFVSTSPEISADGSLTLTVNFKPGTDADKARTQVADLITKVQPTLPPQTKVIGVEVVRPQLEASVAPVAPGQPAPVVPAVPVTPLEPAKTAKLTNEPGNVEYEFTEDGGGIARVVLKEHAVDKSKGTNVILNEFGQIAIGALTEKAGDEVQTKQRWTMLPPNPAERMIAFEWIDAARSVKITKRFSLARMEAARRDRLKEDYLVGLEITYENVGPTPMHTDGHFLHVGGASPAAVTDQSMYQGVDWWRDGKNTFEKVDWFRGGGLIFKDPPRKYYQQDADLIRWMGVTSQYFTTLVTALGGEDKTEEDQRRILGLSAWAKPREISLEEWIAKGHVAGSSSAKYYHIDGAMAVPDVILGKKGDEGSKVVRNYQIYAGPREYRRLRLLEHHESDVLDYGSFLGIPTGPFSRLLLNSMNGLYNLVGGYPLAIVLLTLIVKGLLWPLQSKANRSMKKMSALQPQMKELQARHKDDPAKFQQEMGKMWKKAGVNPLSGCWPIFIQVPIFIGFYNMLGKAVELRHQGFWWVNDLSAPDTVAHIFGLPINPLPLLMATTMFVQMRLAPQGGDPAQRKMFMFMPLIFILMCYNFASALALYWSVQNVISIVQLLVNRNKDAKKVQLVPAK